MTLQELLDNVVLKDVIVFNTLQRHEMNLPVGDVFPDRLARKFQAWTETDTYILVYTKSGKYAVRKIHLEPKPDINDSWLRQKSLDDLWLLYVNFHGDRTGEWKSAIVDAYLKFNKMLSYCSFKQPIKPTGKLSEHIIENCLWYANNQYNITYDDWHIFNDVIRVMENEK